MDVRSDICNTIHLRGALYFRTDFTGPWGATVPALPNAARFHLCTAGECHVRLPGGGQVRLGPGDLILIPYGQSHVLSHAPDAEAAPLETILATVGFSGQGVLAVGNGDPDAATRMVCGHLGFNSGADHPLLRALPDHVLITADERRRAPWLDRTLDMIGETIFAGQPGAVATVTRLSEVVFIEAIRAAGDTVPALGSVLAGFTDPQIGRALALIHEKIADDWTVERLAHAVGMSRSRFAERFHALIGCGPMTYLADWRLQCAMAMLLTSRASVGDVARRSGYHSAAAFSRAFAAHFGSSPSAARRAATDPVRGAAASNQASGADA